MKWAALQDSARWNEMNRDIRSKYSFPMQCEEKEKSRTRSSFVVPCCHPTLWNDWNDQPYVNRKEHADLPPRDITKWRDWFGESERAKFNFSPLPQAENWLAAPPNGASAVIFSHSWTHPHPVLDILAAADHEAEKFHMLSHTSLFLPSSLRKFVIVKVAGEKALNAKIRVTHLGDISCRDH